MAGTCVAKAILDLNTDVLMKNLLLYVVIFVMGGAQAHAADVSVAVAANFTAPMQKIAQSFEQVTGHKVRMAFGATGHFYAQIKNGAPYQLLLAADDKTPLKLEQEGYGVAGSRFTFASGKLVLWSKQPGLVDDKGVVLKTQNYQRLAIANPKLAPYGAAAVETLTNMGLLQAVQTKWVQGENIAQTYQFVASENAQLGFVAMSQVMVEGKIAQGSVWVVPEQLYTPIRQDVVLLSIAKDEAPAKALLKYLRSDKAKEIMRSFGYAMP